MVATRRKKDAPASTDLSAAQVRELYQGSVTSAEQERDQALAEVARLEQLLESQGSKKPAEKIKQKDLYITSLQGQISQLQAQNAALVGDDPEKKALAEIREHIRLLQQDVKARESQTLFEIFGKEMEDQLDTLSRRYDYFDESYKRIQAQARSIEDLERQAETGEKWRAALRETIDRATAEAVGWKERALKAESQAPDVTELKAEIQRLISELDITKQQNSNQPDITAMEVESMRSAIEEYTAERRTLMDENTELRGERAELEETVSDHEEAISRLAGEKRQLTNRLNMTLAFIDQRGFGGELDTLIQNTPELHHDEIVETSSDPEPAATPHLIPGAITKAKAVVAHYQGMKNSTPQEIELTTILNSVLSYCDTQAELRAFDAQIVQEHYTWKAWLKALWKNPHIESARKVGEVALDWIIEDGKDDHGYASVNIESFSDMCGFSRQTGGRIMHESVTSGAHSEIIELEECVVPDKRRGERKIEKKHYHLAATSLLNSPANLRKPDGTSKQGGSVPRCKRCQCENTLRHIYHTFCTHCGYQDIFLPEDVQIRIDELKAQEQSDQAAVTVEGSIQEYTPAPEAEVIDVQDEHETTPDIPEDEIDPELLAAKKLLEQMVQAGVTLRYDEQGSMLIGGAAQNWSDRRADALCKKLVSLHREVKAWYDAYPALLPPAQPAQPAPWDTPCDYCGGTATIWDPDGSGRRICACYTHPEWREQYHASKPVPASHKAVDFTNGEIREVSA